MSTLPGVLQRHRRVLPTRQAPTVAGVHAHLWALPHRLPRWWREAALVVALYAVYDSSRGLARGGAAAGERHADAILHAERFLHIDLEHSLNAYLQHTPVLAVLASYFYATLHFVVTPAVLIWLYRRHHAAYSRARTSLAVATLTALAIFWLFPTTPPRLLAHAGFHDTMAGVSGWGWWAGDGSAPKGLGGLTNQLAAMPSLHVGWALWSGFLLYRFARRSWLRAVGVGYPIATTLVVMSTANHYLLDAVAGAVDVALAALVVLAVSRLTSRGHPWAGHDAAGPEAPAPVEALPAVEITRAAGLSIPRARPLPSASRYRSHFLRLTVAGAVFLVPWIVMLGMTLPTESTAHAWGSAWVGFDAAELLTLAAAALAAWRRRLLVIPIAAVAGTLLLCDAWFDVLLSWGTSGERMSVLSAFAEVPLALYFWWASGSLLRKQLGLARQVSGAARPLRPLRETELFCEPLGDGATAAPAVGPGATSLTPRTPSRAALAAPTAATLAPTEKSEAC